MNIGKKHRLTSDSMNIILQERSITKSGPNAGKERWENIGYFNNPANALKFLADHKLKETGFEDVKAIAKRQEETYRLIESLA